MNELTPVSKLDYQSGAPIDVEANPAPRFRLRKFFGFLRKYWWVPSTTLVLSLAASVVYVLHQPPIFVSRGSLWETVKLHLPEGALFSEDMATFLGTQSELLQSSKLRNLTLAQLRADTNGAAIRWANGEPVDADGNPLVVKIRISQASKSAVFVLEAIGSDGAYTRAYLKALMNVYSEYKKEVRKEVSGEMLDSIQNAVNSAERTLQEQQKILTDFQRNRNLAILQEEGAVAGGYLTRLKTELSDLQLDSQLLNATAKEATELVHGTNQPSGDSNQPAGGTNLEVGDTNLPAAGTNQLPAEPPGLASLPVSVGGAVPSEARTAYQELLSLKSQREKLTNFRPEHPVIKKLDEDIARDERLLEDYRRENREELAASRATTRLKIENVQAAIEEWKVRVIEVNTNLAEADRLKINVQHAQGEYDHLAAMMENVTISRNIDQETLSILEEASPAKRSYLEEKSSLESAAAGGLVLGLGFIVLLTVRDEKFGSVLEVNEKLGDAVIAQVPELPGLNGKLPLLLKNGDSHTYAESYRCLRSALLFLAVDGVRPKVLLITSALPDEGKSTIAANLARTLALGGARVLLVDADLRRGGLHELMGMRQEPGLAHLLNHPADADKSLQTNSLPNLWFIACGSRLNNPGDLFLGASLDQLLDHWRSQFDYVLIDSSPIFAADDATTLAPKVDGTLLVVRSRFSSARQVRGALDMLQQRQARVLGVVFNRADASARSYDYYKYAKYYPVADTDVVRAG